MSRLAIQIQPRADNEFVDAALLDDMAPQDLFVVESEWLAERSLITTQEMLHEGVDRAKWPQNLHWNWSKKAPLLRHEVGGKDRELDSRTPGRLEPADKIHCTVNIPINHDSRVAHDRATVD